MARKMLWIFCAMVLWPWLCRKFMWCCFMVTWWWLWLCFSSCVQRSCGVGLSIEKLWTYKREKVADTADRYSGGGGASGGAFSEGACLCVGGDGYSWDGLERGSLTGVVGSCDGSCRGSYEASTGEYDRKVNDKKYGVYKRRLRKESGRKRWSL